MCVLARVRSNGQEAWVPAQALALRNTPLRVAEVLVTAHPPGSTDRQWLRRSRVRVPRARH